MTLGFKFSNLRRVTSYEYAIRFVLGGLVTLAAGLIAHAFGPATGGLFLAFPAIFPASATLIEKHEVEKKQKHGLSGVIRGRRAAALDALGAAMGSIGLGFFAVIVWQLLPRYGALAVSSAATIAWLVVSLVAWRIRRSL